MRHARNQLRAVVRQGIVLLCFSRRLLCRCDHRTDLDGSLQEVRNQDIRLERADLSGLVLTHNKSQAEAARRQKKAGVVLDVLPFHFLCRLHVEFHRLLDLPKYTWSLWRVLSAEITSAEIAAALSSPVGTFTTAAAPT